jgi:hypothetical protein
VTRRHQFRRSLRGLEHGPKALNITSFSQTPHGRAWQYENILSDLEMGQIGDLSWSMQAFDTTQKPGPPARIRHTWSSTKEAAAVRCLSLHLDRGACKVTGLTYQTNQSCRSRHGKLGPSYIMLPNLGSSSRICSWPGVRGPEPSCHHPLRL